MTLQQIKAQIYSLGTYKQQKIEAYGKMKKNFGKKFEIRFYISLKLSYAWKTLKKRPISTQILSLPIF